MSNWTSDLDRKIKARKEAEAERKADEEARRRKRQEEERKQEAEKRLRQHKRDYKCCICGKLSDGPTHVSTELTTDEGFPIRANDGSCITSEYDDWHRPANLSRCSICGKWACSGSPIDPHIHWDVCGNVCKSCYKKGYLPVAKRRLLDWLP